MNPRKLVARIPGARSAHRRWLASANVVTLEFLATTECEVIGEIGVWQGRSSEGFASFLDGRGRLYLFDFEDVVEPVAARLTEAGHSNVVAYGNSRLLLDSYNWSLMRLLSEHEAPVFDYVYIDGAHTWHHDALAFLLIDRLLKPGGYVDFDDYGWTIDASPSVNPRAAPEQLERYTQEQIVTPQIELIAELLVRRDPRYQEVMENKIFQKRAA